MFQLKLKRFQLELKRFQLELILFQPVDGGVKVDDNARSLGNYLLNPRHPASPPSLQISPGPSCMLPEKEKGREHGIVCFLF